MKGPEVHIFVPLLIQKTLWLTSINVSLASSRCALHPGAVLYGDHVACDAVHGTGVAQEGESTLPPT